MELGGSTSTLPSSDCAVFLDNELVSAATTSSSIALTIALVELCGIESITTLENFVEFRWRNLWQSTIDRSPVKIWTGIWMSLGRGVQLLARTFFGRSNR